MQKGFGFIVADDGGPDLLAHLVLFGDGRAAEDRFATVAGVGACPLGHDAVVGGDFVAEAIEAPLM